MFVQEKENIIGPFEVSPSKGFVSLSLLGVSNDYLYCIRLNLATQIKYSISMQIPFLYTTHIYNLTQKSIKELGLTYKVEKIRVDEYFSFKVERSSLWRHKIFIKNKQFDLKFHVLNRGAVDDYEELLLNLVGNKYRLKE